MEKVSSDQSEPVKIELRAYIEDWGKFSMKKIIKELVLALWLNME